MANYVLEGPFWRGGAAGGPLVTWSLDASLPSFFQADIQAAFADWSAHANIRFTQVAAAGQITLGEAPIDGADDTLGVTDFNYAGKSLLSADVTFDSAENWHLSGSKVVSTDGVDLFLVALHEIGHAIGLDHYNAAPAVMNAFLNASVTDLASSDIAGVQALYGAPVAASASTETASAVVQASTVSPAGLFDAAFYLAHNPDVASAGVDPAAHYAQHGWTEGRDPNAFFSTVGYLAASRGSVAPGTDPLLQFDQTGWHGGSDPSARFDDELYLAHNPDVAAAGMDPLGHYLLFGQAEGRQAFAAIGKAADLATHNGFDAEYYLLANPDVAKAALAGGGDTFAFAWTHFDTQGWHESRNPNAVFDTAGYLAANPDVKAAGIDPLVHYDQYGWREGRDPSALFDTKAYESHYGDVKAAGIDPLLHYLQHGELEGRSSFGDGHFA